MEGVLSLLLLLGPCSGLERGGRGLWDSLGELNNPGPLPQERSGTQEAPEENNFWTQISANERRTSGKPTSSPSPPPVILNSDARYSAPVVNTNSDSRGWNHAPSTGEDQSFMYGEQGRPGSHKYTGEAQSAEHPRADAGDWKQGGWSLSAYGQDSAPKSKDGRSRLADKGDWRSATPGGAERGSHLAGDRWSTDGTAGWSTSDSRHTEHTQAALKLGGGPQRRLAGVIQGGGAQGRLAGVIQGGGAQGRPAGVIQGGGAQGRLGYVEDLVDGSQEQAESRTDQVLRVHRLTSETLGSLQGVSPRGGVRSSQGHIQSTQGGGLRRSGTNEVQEKSSQIQGRRMDVQKRQGEIMSDTEETLSLDRTSRRGNKGGKDRPPTQVATASVLDIIQNLQEEIKDIDAEINKETEKMRKLKKAKETEAELDASFGSNNAAQVSAEETMKELNLQKEDTTMKKIIAQMMLMKQIQKKKSESEKLETALEKLAGRRKVINLALRKQKEVAEEKRKLAQLEISRQKEIMEEKEKVIQALIQRQEEDRRVKSDQKLQEQKKISLAVKENIKQKTDIAGKADLLEAHLKLVDRSNDRILARIQEIKILQEKEAIREQESVLQDQQAAITALRELQKERRKNQQKKKKQKGNNQSASLTKVNLRDTAALSLSPQERKQIGEWLDLERNAEILQKTDFKIAEKLKAKTAADSLSPSNAALKLKNAAQILLDEEDDVSDTDIDDLLGISGIDSGLSVDEILNLKEPDIIELDEDALLFDDYDDNNEVLYEYEEEDEEEYDEKEYNYEYETKIIKAKPKPRPRPTTPKPRYRGSKPRQPEPRPYTATRYLNPPTSGAQFLEDVSGLLGRAEVSIDHGVSPHITLTGSLRNALLRDVNDQISTEVRRLPGGRVSTKVRIGSPELRLSSNPSLSRTSPSDFNPDISSLSSSYDPPILRRSPQVSGPGFSRLQPAFNIDPRTPNLKSSSGGPKHSSSGGPQYFSGGANTSSGPRWLRESSPKMFSDLVQYSKTSTKVENNSPSFSDLVGDLLMENPLPPELTGQFDHPGNLRLH